MGVDMTEVGMALCPFVSCSLTHSVGREYWKLGNWGQREEYCTNEGELWNK